jgi:hypothetical protein
MIGGDSVLSSPTDPIGHQSKPGHYRFRLSANPQGIHQLVIPNTGLGVRKGLKQGSQQVIMTISASIQA